MPKPPAKMSNRFRIENCSTSLWKERVVCFTPTIVANMLPIKNGNICVKVE